MSLFNRLRSIPRPLSSADTADVLAARQEYAEGTANAVAARNDAYRGALADVALTDLAVDTPAVQRTHRELAEAQERHERALVAVDVAASDHAAALAREAAAATKSFWDDLERLAAARTAAGSEATQSLTATAAARAKFAEASKALFVALPSAIKAQPHYHALTVAAAQEQYAAEHERVVNGWRPRSTGTPPPAPLANLGREAEAMLKQARADAGA